MYGQPLTVVKYTTVGLNIITFFTSRVSGLVVNRCERLLATNVNNDAGQTLRAI